MGLFLSPKAVQDEIASIVRGSTIRTVSYIKDVGHMVCFGFDIATVSYLTVLRRLYKRTPLRSRRFCVEFFVATMVVSAVSYKWQSFVWALYVWTSPEDHSTNTLIANDMTDIYLSVQWRQKLECILNLCRTLHTLNVLLNVHYYMCTFHNHCTPIVTSNFPSLLHSQ